MSIMNLVINGLAVLISGYLLPGVHVDNFITALIVAVVLAIINMLVKPVLLLLTLPLTVLTLGLFYFILNGLLVLLAARLVPGFSVDGLLWAIIFGLVVSVVNSLLHGLTK